MNPRWEFSTRASYLSGRPFTPYNQQRSIEQRRGIYDLSRINFERAPAYFRVDFRVDRTFMIRDKPFTVFAGVQNATNRRNVSFFAWNRRLNRAQFNDQMRLFPIIGLDWRFR